VNRWFWGSLLVAFVILAGTAEERTFGMITDEESVLRTAVSMAEFREVGIARSPNFVVKRAAGDAVSPYGMGQALVEILPASAALAWERRFGAGSSQTLFVLLQILLVTAAAAGAGLLARELGAPPAGEAVAVLGTAVGSPLWAYASSGYSEPLQAVALVFALLFALRRTPRAALAAGLLAGFAALTKPTNLAVAPLALLPLLMPPVWRAVAAAAAGAALPLAAFLGFEVARFGRPFAGYSEGHFSHSVPDGLWRLLVGPNKGLLLYFPLLVLAILGLAKLTRTERRSAAIPSAAVFGALLVIASAWWAWDGTVGWGPRFLVPAIPFLAAAAGASGWLRTGAALVLAGLSVNALGVFQSEGAAFAYLSSTPGLEISAEEAKRLPLSYIEKRPDGSLRVPRNLTVAKDAAYSPLRVHAFLLAARGTDRLASPPWLASHPEAVPAGVPGPVGAFLKTPRHWPHLFAATRRMDGTFHKAWNGALADQAIRAVDIGEPARAVAVSTRLYDLSSAPYTAALRAEALRSARQFRELVDFVAGLPAGYRGSPILGIVQALAARDLGDEESARRILSAVARAMKNPRVERALAAPLSEWPPTLHAMTE